MFVHRNGLQVVYQGTSHCCKVNRLQEQSIYRFCISAANDAGQGPDSSFYEFSTTIAPPPSLKGNKKQGCVSLTLFVGLSGEIKNNLQYPIHCLKLTENVRVVRPIIGKRFFNKLRYQQNLKI